MRPPVLLAIGLVFACASTRAPALTLWDADFNEQPLGALSPGNQAGPPELPTFLRSTNATYSIVAASGDLADQPFEVVQVGQFAIPRVAFRLSQADLEPIAAGTVQIGLDMLAGDCTTRSGSTACYKISLVNVGQVEWGLDGGLRLIGAIGDPDPIPYVPDVAKRFEIGIDLGPQDPLVTVHVDDQLLGTAALPAAALFDGLALETGGLTASGRFAFDNVQVEFVPEPGEGLLVAVSAATFLAYGAVRTRRAGAAARG